jgi:hypothetical protein
LDILTSTNSEVSVSFQMKKIFRVSFDNLTNEHESSVGETPHCQFVLKMCVERRTRTISFDWGHRFGNTTCARDGRAMPRLTIARKPDMRQLWRWVHFSQTCAQAPFSQSTTHTFNRNTDALSLSVCKQHYSLPKYAVLSFHVAEQPRSRRASRSSVVRKGTGAYGSDSKSDRIDVVVGGWTPEPSRCHTAAKGRGLVPSHLWEQQQQQCSLSSSVCRTQHKPRLLAVSSWHHHPSPHF